MSTVNDITIRGARLIDLDRLVVLWRALMQHHIGFDSRLFQTEVHAPSTYRAWLRRKLDEPDAMILVAEGAEGIIGFLLAKAGQRAPVFTVREVGMIYDLVVDPACRRQGAGQALFNEAKAGFQARGITHITVNYSPANEHASRFWIAQGFAPLLTEAYLEIDD